MGWLKNAKTQAMATAAAKAYATDDEFFTPLLNVPMFNSSASGPVEDIAGMMGAITSAGWKLHTWTVPSDKNGRPQAMPLFVR